MLNKLNCIQANVSMELSKISGTTVKKSYKKKLKSKLFSLNKNKCSNLISSTLTSQFNNYSIPKYMDEFSDYSDDTESDISTCSVMDEDLNSSVSSVSSLEHEPFELCETRNFKKSFVRKPLLSSSRTSLIKTNPKISSFHPKITSSRKSLMENKINCLQCKNDSLPGVSGYFSFMEDQICSSTHVSIDFKAKDKSESIFTNSSIFSLSSESSESF